ncbi:unnamed protein product [Cuscuta epithymum]|uniref:Uncharacterized protein n=1 Tax=Cuscuta epithymum TaxID=186058 RepID=A0AAV0FG02_9ASTE|nr:unnamed protein product [Cuscuta epithymum]
MSPSLKFFLHIFTLVLLLGEELKSKSNSTHLLQIISGDEPLLKKHCKKLSENESGPGLMSSVSKFSEGEIGCGCRAVSTLHSFLSRKPTVSSRERADAK